MYSSISLLSKLVVHRLLIERILHINHMISIYMYLSIQACIYVSYIRVRTYQYLFFLILSRIHRKNSRSTQSAKAPSQLLHVSRSLPHPTHPKNTHQAESSGDLKVNLGLHQPAIGIGEPIGFPKWSHGGFCGDFLQVFIPWHPTFETKYLANHTEINSTKDQRYDKVRF